MYHIQMGGFPRLLPPCPHCVESLIKRSIPDPRKPTQFKAHFLLGLVLWFIHFSIALLIRMKTFKA